jgi:hypothetical protein
VTLEVVVGLLGLVLWIVVLDVAHVLVNARRVRR